MFRILFIIVLLSPTATLARSEITGYLSTDPTRPDKEITQEAQIGGEIKDPQDDERVSSGASSGVLHLDATPKAVAEEQKTQEEQPIVLGITRWAENTLVRDEGGRIYIIKGNTKKVVWDLEELWLYRDREIIDLPDEELALYPTRRFFANKLIRQIGTESIYVVENGIKRHIKSLEELKRDYQGQKIFNIPAEEIAYY